MAQALVVVGTTSHAGKSLLTAVICRILAQRNHRVTPFKGQNMALNAYVTADGGEIGYAQAVQAWAAGVEPQINMNPILLKPQGDMTSQVILRGKAVGKTGAADYYRDYFDRGWAAICQSLAELSEQFDWIVCEGAGSPAEINLKHRDLTNMRVAKHLQAPTLLVADIDRGGVFAHIIGTLELLEPDERALIKGFVINKFRGQRSLLQSGLDWLEERTGIPVVGVIPYVDIQLPAEDSLDLFERRTSKTQTDLEIAVIRLPRIANFTDFDPLLAEPTVKVRYVGLHDTLGQPDAVILPGSKTTISDLKALVNSGLGEAIKTYASNGGTVFGICGGMQMLGREIDDPEGLEGLSGMFPGLGLLPLTTTITPAKITQQRQATVHYPDKTQLRGYEIHQGITDFQLSFEFESLFTEPGLGIVNQAQTVWGAYLHGLFDSGSWRRAWLNRLRAKKSLPPLPTQIHNFDHQCQAMLSHVTDLIAPHLNLEPLIGAV